MSCKGMMIVENNQQVSQKVSYYKRHIGEKGIKHVGL